MAPVELIATSAFGLEAVVGRELTQLGYEQQAIADGRITFAADKIAICRSNLWLRSADRVLLKMGEFDAMDFGQLFDQTKAMPWGDLLPVDAEFPVRGKSVRSQLSSVPHCQSIVKKAIVESLRSSYQRHRFEESGPRFDIEIAIVRNRATLSIDTSGAGLHKRGYRTMTGAAPIRETLAAALVQLSYWNRERPLIDPLCGTGTIPIEAALIGRNRAPGLKRSFVAEDWPWLDRKLWGEARSEARDLAQPKLPWPIIATDRAEGVLRFARKHIQQAGVEADVHLQQRALSDLKSSRKYGCIICNPPWGARFDRREAETVSNEMRDVFGRLETWSFYVISALPQFEKLFGRKADRRRKLYNGRIESTYYQFHGPRPPQSQESKEPVA